MQGLRDHNAALGGRTERLALAVGLSRTGPRPDEPVADRSALLRLTDAERLDAEYLAAALRTAPTQAPPPPGGGRLAVALARRLAPRLGSTVLVSHLGRVSAPAYDRIAFAPVTLGGSGLSLGAVTLDERTVLTARARGTSWDDDGLERVLEAVVRRLP
ncbi:MAG: hypothetical protein CMH83_21780 [Nocardioides sp.]|nr:hypothetical protein [Nocardioides sp.]